MERPYLPIPTPEPIDRGRGRGGGGNVTRPGAARQQQRLGDRFDRLAELMGQGRIGELIQDPSSLAPERALVFEVAGGSLADFARQAQQIGLEYLLEEEDRIPSTEDFKVVERSHGQERIRDDKPVPIHFYLAMPDETALQQLVTLWRTFQRGESFPHGYAPWRDLFERLLTVRPWGPQDRIQPEDQSYFLEQIANEPDRPIRCELELWFSDSEDHQLVRSTHIRRIVEQAEGNVLAESRISEIRYHGVLCELPSVFVGRLAALEQTVELLRADDVMFIRPQSMAARDEADPNSTIELDPEDRVDAADGNPLVAILDGYPLENHQLLAGRLEIDDPDDLGARYASFTSRVHGTSIASLIVRGDTNRPSQPIMRRIHVRPVMCSPDGGNEQFPPEQLLIDTIYRAVTRLFDGEGGGAPSAPTIRVINVSLGDSSRPFARRMSPWARLLDFLSWRYHVLFIISAGNVDLPIDLPGFNGLIELEQADPNALEIAILDAANNQRSRRSVLSPAESINAITVGAHHEDALQQVQIPATQFDPYCSPGLPSIISRLGLGYRGAVKPEVLYSGGRNLLSLRASGAGVRLAPSRVFGRFCGIGSAIPDAGGRLNVTSNASSTSTAAALATRQAHLVMDELLESGHVEEGDPFLALYAKALLVHHSRSHPGTYRRLETILNGPQGTDSKKRDIARFLTFGASDYDFDPGCSQARAILIGHNRLRADHAHRFSIPAPEDLHGRRGWRAITITVAWFSPINPRHQMYRMGKLDVKLPASVLGTSGSGVKQVDQNSWGKGTIYHRRLEGDAITSVRAGQTFEFDIECFAQAGPLDDFIPYAVAISVEVGDQLGIDVYQQISQRLRVQV